MEETRHERYLREKANYSITYRGIKLNEVGVYYFWHLCNGMTHESVKRILILFTKYDLGNFLSFDKTKHSILSTFAGTRNDNKAEYDFVYEQIHDFASYNLLADCPRKFCVSWNILRVLWLLIPCFRKSSLSFVQKVFLYVHYVQTCNTIDSFLSRDWSGVNKYLCMFNAQDYESMMTQYFHSIGIPTYSLDEGVHFIYKTNTPVDATQYENIQTDHLLCWGQYTKDEYESYGIDSRRLLVAGYPVKIKQQPFIKKEKFKRAVLLLARPIFNETNFALLNLIKGYTKDIEFCIKLHPACDYDSYKKFADQNGLSIIDSGITVQQCLNNLDYDFAIAINTTAYYEALILGLPCLRFADGSFDLMAGYDDVFSDSLSFKFQYQKIESLDIELYAEEVNKSLKNAMGFGINNYRQIMLDLEKTL